MQRLEPKPVKCEPFADPALPNGSRQGKPNARDKFQKKTLYETWEKFIHTAMYKVKT